MPKKTYQVDERAQQDLVDKTMKSLEKISSACIVKITDDPIDGEKSMIAIFAKKAGVDFNMMIPWELAEWCRASTVQIIRTHMKSRGGACHVSVLKPDNQDDVVRIDVMRGDDTHTISMPWKLMASNAPVANQIIRSNWI